MVAFGGSSLTCVTTGAFGVWGEIEARIQINWGEPHLVAIQTLGFLPSDKPTSLRFEQQPPY